MEDDSAPPPFPVRPTIEPPVELPPKPPLSRRLFYYTLALGLAGAVFFAISRYDTLKRQKVFEPAMDITQALVDSAAVYVGIPLILALGLSLTGRGKSPLGATMKGITIALLLSAPVFQEGYICILMAAPLFYAVGALAAVAFERSRRNRLRAAFVPVLLALLATEGTTQATSFPRDNVVTRSEIIPAGFDTVRARLAAVPRIDNERAAFLHIFPSATYVTGSGLEVGDTRRATFIAYKHIWWTRVEGSLDMHVAESTPTRIVFAVDSDDSYLSHYLKWQTSTVNLTPVDATHTEVRWTLAYRRILDPVWYFGPMQRYAVGLTATKLIDDLCGRS